ncbi:hypothetical protein BG003_000395 [Podila horticola]|nr:hypothetical protein BG003_000395 [Podila horticola]
MGSLVHQLLCACPKLREVYAMTTEKMGRQQWFRFDPMLSVENMEVGSLDSDWICTDRVVLALQFEGERSFYAPEATEQDIVPEKLIRQLVKMTKAGGVSTRASDLHSRTYAGGTV